MPVAAQRFRDAGRIEKYGLITCGFELETQETEGHTWNSIAEDSDEIDDRYYEAVSERVSEIMGSVADYLPTRDADRLRESIEQRVIDDDEIDRSEYRAEGDPVGYMVSNYSIPSDVIVGQDGSVEGFEFRTRGARSFTQFMKAARGIFGLSHAIDTDCSFHIHLAIKDVKHTYGERLHMAMVEFLAENIDRAPESVRKRWSKIDGNQYISQLIGETEKYCFVRKHPQGTWEFRCFGNVTNAADARICLDLAVEAMAFGYKAVSGQAALQADSLASRAEWKTWSSQHYVPVDRCRLKSDPVPLRQESRLNY